MKHIIDWKSFLLPYELAVSGFIMKLGAIKKEYILKGENSPIEIVSGRVKSVPSILEKAKSQYKEFDSDKEAAIYFSKCDFPGIMFCMRKNRDVKKAIWNLIKKNKI